MILIISCGENKKNIGATNPAALSPGELHLSDQQIQLGNITTDSLKKHELGEDILLMGKVNANQNKMVSISSRVMGRIERLYFKTTGDLISVGDPLYEIYSEDLNMTVRELLLATEKKKSLKNPDVDYEKILQTAKTKLILYGLTNEQIGRIQSEKKEPFTVKILSKVAGVIYSIDTKEGNYVMEGNNILHLTDYSTVWVEAQVYSDFIYEIRPSMEAKISFPSLPGKEVYGNIGFVNPELNPSSKINLVRVEIKNPNNELQLGSLAYLSLLLKKKWILSLPTDAIIKDGKGSTVWLQFGKNKFKSRMVQTGIESNGYTEILDGLNAGDVVVVTGAYLLNSEYVFNKGTNPMEGHSHSK
ncbi:MAG: efflux RND transporter periplasmic adaptor subunit [Bacteroidetes bacterium]|nr:efflux RND transporter periplasmic adaptor subunit [Bacteroidota bacterium]